MGKCVLDQNFNPNRRNTFNQNVHHAPVGFLKSIPWTLKSDIDTTFQITILPDRDSVAGSVIQASGMVVFEDVLRTVAW